MNRFKFRVWDKELKKFLPLQGQNCAVAPLMDMEGRFWDWASQHWGIDNELTNNPQNLILTQFTGILDKNGKEIYEGDLIQTERRFQRKQPKNHDYRNPVEIWPEETEIKIYKVVFDKICQDDFYCSPVLGWGLRDSQGGLYSLIGEIGRFSGEPWDDTYVKWTFFDYRLIGNIFENSELYN